MMVNLLLMIKQVNNEQLKDMLEDWTYLSQSYPFTFVLDILIYIFFILPILFLIGIISGCIQLKNPLEELETFISVSTYNILLKQVRRKINSWYN